MSAAVYRWLGCGSATGGCEQRRVRRKRVRGSARVRARAHGTPLSPARVHPGPISPLRRYFRFHALLGNYPLATVQHFQGARAARAARPAALPPRSVARS